MCCRAIPLHLVPTPLAPSANRFDAALRKEIILPRPSLVRACRLTFGREFLQLGWLKAANTALGFSGPLLLKVVVDAVQDAAESQGSIH